MAAPPLLPAARLKRVVDLARLNGRGVLWLCLASAAVVPFTREWLEAGLALIAAAAGLIELHGRRRLLAGDVRGLRWLVGAQLWLLGLVLAYAAWRWVHVTGEQAWQALPGFMQRHVNREFELAGLDPAAHRGALMLLTNRLTSLALSLVALAYQGSLAVWYLRQRPALHAALSSPPPAPPRTPK